MSKPPLTEEQSAQITRDINALPEPLRTFVMWLETEADPAGTIRNVVLLREENAGLRKECKLLALDAQRYRYLRDRPEDAIGEGGVFAGMTPATGKGGFILTEEDLDRAVDEAMAAEAAKP